LSNSDTTPLLDVKSGLLADLITDNMENRDGNDLYPCSIPVLGPIHSQGVCNTDLVGIRIGIRHTVIPLCLSKGPSTITLVWFFIQRLFLACFLCTVKVTDTKVSGECRASEDGSSTRVEDIEEHDAEDFLCALCIF